MNSFDRLLRCWLIGLLLFIVYSEGSQGKHRIYLEESCRLVVLRCTGSCDNTKLPERAKGADCVNLSLVSVAVDREKSKTSKFHIGVINRESRPMRFTPLRFNPLHFPYYENNKNIYISEGPTTSFYLPIHKMKDHTKLIFSTMIGDVAVIFLQDNRYILCVYPVAMEHNNFIRIARRSSYLTKQFPDAKRNNIYLERQPNSTNVVNICIDNSPKLLDDSASHNISDAYNIDIKQHDYVTDAEKCKGVRDDNKLQPGIADYIDVNADDMADVMLFDNREPRFMNNEVITYDSTTRDVRKGWLAVVLPIGTTCALLTIVLGFCGENIMRRFVS